MDTDTYLKRLTAVRQLLAGWQVDAVLIVGYANRRWLSGFTGSNATLLISETHALLATDSRYFEQAVAEAPHFTLFKHERTPQHAADFLQTVNARRIGLEGANLTLNEAHMLKTAVSDIDWSILSSTVEPLRMIKTDTEIGLIRRAAAITDGAMALVPEIVRVGMTEKALAWALEKAMRDAGADGLAFDILVASGPNAALPHHHAGERPLQAGDPLIVDMGAMLNGYRSDMTRSFFLGDALTEPYQTIYQTVLDAQTAVLEQARPGMANRTVDAIARDMIHAAGHGDHFQHGLGHGLGLDIHEEPFLSPRTDLAKQLAVNMTLTVEPGIYLPGWGGVRIEDLTVIREAGLEQLSHAPKTPLIPIRT